MTPSTSERTYTNRDLGQGAEPGPELVRWGFRSVAESRTNRVERQINRRDRCLNEVRIQNGSVLACRRYEFELGGPYFLLVAHAANDGTERSAGTMSVSATRRAVSVAPGSKGAG